MKAFQEFLSAVKKDDSLAKKVNAELKAAGAKTKHDFLNVLMQQAQALGFEIMTRNLSGASPVSTEDIDTVISGTGFWEYFDSNSLDDVKSLFPDIKF